VTPDCVKATMALAWSTSAARQADPPPPPGSVGLAAAAAGAAGASSRARRGPPTGLHLDRSADAGRRRSPPRMLASAPEDAVATSVTSAGWGEG